MRLIVNPFHQRLSKAFFGIKIQSTTGQRQRSFLSSLAGYFFKFIYCPGYCKKWNGKAHRGILMWSTDHVWTVAPERTTILHVYTGKTCFERSMIRSGSWIYYLSSSFRNVQFEEKKKKYHKGYYKHKNQWRKQPLLTQAKSKGEEEAWIFPTQDHRLVLLFLPQNVHQSLQQPVVSVLVRFCVVENIDIVTVQTVLSVFSLGRFVQLFQGFVEIFIRDAELCTWRLLCRLLCWWVLAECTL